ncbi:MAG TPA: helix-turn-helix domain-containing protein [Spirochaetales bacterium]|nr:helix-turn-helix domain-containing protein [Spirochaetales bacterium]
MSGQQGTGTRPRWSASEAARRCGVGRATIQRALSAGKFPNASKTDNGWTIPLEDLLAAGFRPDRPAPPDAPAREHDQEGTGQVPELTARLRALRAELDTERARTESERALRAAAEHLAAVQEQRANDLKAMLRALQAAPAAAAPEPAPGRSLLSRLLGR